MTGHTLADNESALDILTAYMRDNGFSLTKSNVETMLKNWGIAFSLFSIGYRDRWERMGGKK